MARKTVGTCAPSNGTVNCESATTVKSIPGCVGVIGTLTIALRYEVKVGRRLRDDLDRICPALPVRVRESR